MVGKTYLRYVVGPQGGSLASSAALNMESAVIRPTYGAAQRGSGLRRPGAPPSALASASVLFLPSLEAVRVYSVRSGKLLHTLIPASAKMPVEVTGIHLVSLDPVRSVAQPSIESNGWLLLVGYSNGFVAVFSCGPSNHYGSPVCRFYALGHKVDTAVLSLTVNDRRTTLCSAGQDTDVTVWDLVSEEASYRLRGHRGGVVALHHVPSGEHDSNLLVSAAADGLIKVWNLTLRQCIQTCVASDAQITSMVLDRSCKRAYCGMRESFVKVYNVESLLSADAGSDAPSTVEGRDAAISTSTPLLIQDHGMIPRKYYKPITAFHFSQDGHFLLACTSKTVEVFRARTAEDVRRKVLRKRKRARATNKAGEDEDEDGDDEEGKTHADNKEEDELAVPAASVSPAGDARQPTAAEEWTLLRTFFMPIKVRSACFVSTPSAARSAGGDEDVQIAVTYNNNTVQTFSTRLTTTELSGAATWTLDDLKPMHQFDHAAHTTAVQRLMFVDTDTALLSMSKDKILLWTVTVKTDLLEQDHVDHHDFYDAQEANLARVDFKGSLNCVGSVNVEEAVAMDAITSGLCCVGQQDGSVLLIDVASTETIVSEPGIHTGGVKLVVKRPDKSGFLTGGADRRLLLWTVGVVAEDKTKKKSTATLLQAQEVELTEFPLFAAFSPDLRYLGVGLQNNTIQLFFADSLKPYLSLFGHKLPPTSMDFSTDGTLVASVGMDKSLRFWGTDFGDCHRAIHAHDDYVTAVQFVQDTHYVFTVSMDGSVKQWDGDNWTMIQLFRQHQRGLWAVAVTSNGTCVATAGVDRCIRCFLRTEDIVFPQEEEERMAQEAMDEETTKRAAMHRLEGNTAVDAGVAGHQTAATNEAAERIMEALDIVSVEQQRQQNADDSSPRHPLLMNRTEWEYLWSVIESVRPSELRHALTALTSVHVDAMLNAVESMMAAGVVQNIEIAARVVLALVLPPPGQTSTLSAVSGEVSEVQGARRLESLRRTLADGLDHSVSRVDYNIAGLQMVRQHLEDSEKVKFFDLSKMQGYKKKYHSRAL